MELRSSSPAILAGKLFDDRGHAMSPTHANKAGVRYRYYVSQALLQGRKNEAGSVSRVGASEVENARVLTALCTRSPTGRYGSSRSHWPRADRGASRSHRRHAEASSYHCCVIRKRRTAPQDHHPVSSHASPARKGVAHAAASDGNDRRSDTSNAASRHCPLDAMGRGDRLSGKTEQLRRDRKTRAARRTSHPVPGASRFPVA